MSSISKTDNPRRSIDALYREIFERGVRACLPDAHVAVEHQGENSGAPLTIDASPDAVVLTWLGGVYRVTRAGAPLSDGELLLLRSVGLVLAARYEILFDPAAAAESFEVFRGLAEDRYISAWLDAGPYRSGATLLNASDRIADAINVLRIASSSTYENRRISTGVLLFGTQPDPCHPPPRAMAEALRYDGNLTLIRSFHRLCDGLRTVAMVDGGGHLVDLVDVEEWAEPFAEMELPAPCAARYRGHCRATLCGGHVCMVLTPNGEIKVFSNGTQTFNFVDGRWRLSDVNEKFTDWERAVGDRNLAERLFTTALNLADDRRGGLFVVLDDAGTASHLVSAADNLVIERGRTRERGGKDRLHYLLRDKSVTELTPTVLESIARIDGGIVLDRSGRLIAFGAILRHQTDLAIDPDSVEGGRTTAALAASHHGAVLKVSEDGPIAFYKRGRCMWEL